jgi:hypothetical protein
MTNPFPQGLVNKTYRHVTADLEFSSTLASEITLTGNVTEVGSRSTSTTSSVSTTVTVESDGLTWTAIPITAGQEKLPLDAPQITPAPTSDRSTEPTGTAISSTKSGVVSRTGIEGYWVVGIAVTVVFCVSS